jgi:Metallo-peptidase family M12/FG-GAP-like repeat/PKD-like domain
MKTMRFAVVVSILVFSVSSLSAAMQSRLGGEALAPLQNAGARAKLTGVSLDGGNDTLELQRFEVFAPNAEIIAFGAGGHSERLPRPDVRYYRGEIAGEPDSLVFLAVSASRAEGFAFKGERRFTFGSRRRVAQKGGPKAFDYDVMIDEVNVSDEMPVDGQGFVCDVEKLSLNSKPMTAMGATGLTPKVTGVLATGTARWLLNLAIDTDYELYVNSGSSSANVTTYIGNLAGAVATIYRRDLTTDILVSYLGIQTSSADPFVVVPGTAGTWNGNPVTYNTQHALAELGDRWHNSPPSSAPRSSTILISGKSIGAGIAWLGTICQGDFFCNNGNCGSTFNGHYGGRYAFVGAVTPPFDLSVPNPDANAPAYTAPSSNYWSILATSHELGHNVGSTHTHCITLSPADQATYGRAFVDNCYNSEGGCSTGSNIVPAEKGTIMSYCHLNGGGTQTRYTFGKTGEASYVVPDAMKADIQSLTPTMSAIGLSAASLAAGATGTASVANVGGITYLWSISNGVINSGGSTNAITFTANTNPVVLTVRATNSNGCSVTDSASVAVTAAATPTRDFNGDGSSDVLWRNSASGQIVAWFLNGSIFAGGASLGIVGDLSWKLAGAADFNHDGRLDLLWRSSATGANAVWFMNGTVLTSSADLPPAPDLNWNIEATGDFNGDTWPDIAFHHHGTGRVVIWLMNGTVRTGAVEVGTASDLNWHIVGAGDFNADNHVDLAWRHATNGFNVFWRMNGTTLVSGVEIDGLSDNNWKITGVADYNGNGTPDFFWHNTANGANAIWYVNNFAFAGGAAVDGLPDLSWQGTGPR